MATHSNYALRVPPSLMEDLRMAAGLDGVSMNGFIVQAVAEKVAMLRARGRVRDMTVEEQAAFFRERTRNVDPARFADILAKAGTTTEIRPGDEIPEGWLQPQEG